jgi:hypothetical protein
MHCYRLQFSWICLHLFYTGIQHGLHLFMMGIYLFLSGVYLVLNGFYFSPILDSILSCLIFILSSMAFISASRHSFNMLSHIRGLCD